MNKTELILLLWDLPMWILGEIKWSIYNRWKAFLLKIGIDK